MNRIILGLGMIAVVAGLSLGASGAFFTDTETSTGNTFTAGALDLKVDSTAHYNSMVCTAGTPTEGNPTGYTWQPEAGFEPGPDHYPQPGTPCTGTWEESDLLNSIKYRFFNLTDVKPGDEGEDTISLHVYDNDAWGCFLVDNVVNADNTCTEPEEGSGSEACTQLAPEGPINGELGSALTFDAWLDQGAIPGFQNVDAEGNVLEVLPDPTEGDNIYQESEGPKFWNDETIDSASEGPFAIKDVLGAAYALANANQANNCSATGDTNYASCHGLAADGRMVGSTTYYFGLGWNIPDTVGNEIQTDSIVADMNFEVAQHRNNPNFSCTPRPEATTLTLEKVIQQDGTNVVTEALWTLMASSTSNMTVISGVETDPAVTAAPVPAGDYVLSESVVQGFTQSNLQCVGGVLVGNTVTVPLGANVVCTFTNTENT